MTASTCPITRRQLDYVAAAADGLSNQQIGRLLHVTENTVKAQLLLITRKLSALNRAHIVSICLRGGWIS